MIENILCIKGLTLEKRMHELHILKNRRLSPLHGSEV